MSSTIFNVVSLFLIGLIIWWFWLSKPKLKKVTEDIIKIIVKDGVYQPARIETSDTHPITLEFLRKDSSPCSEYVDFDTLDIHVKLPLDKPHVVELGQLAKGTYSFNCQMKMYVGEIQIN